MKLNQILKQGCYTPYSEEVYESIIDGIKQNNITITIRLDAEYHGVTVYASGGYADISEDDEGIRIEWYRLLTGLEVTHIKEEVIDL